ncbi:MAG: haloacid dehalogenase-like hydrolase [Bacteroidales bacterium]
MKEIAFFDFDGTLYKKDSTIEFCIFCIKKRPLLFLLLPIQILYYILYKLKITSVETFKGKFFIFLKMIKAEDHSKLLSLFWEKEFNTNMNTEICKKLEILKKNKVEVYIISASPEFLIEIPTKKLNADFLIGTKLNLGSTNINGKNCRGKEKKIRLEQLIGKDYKILEAYSDNKDDHFLLNIAEIGIKV